MKWRRQRRSGDLIDRRGARPSGGSMGGMPMIGKMGIPGLLVMGLLFFLSNMGGDGGGGTSGLDDILGDLNQPQGEAGADPLPPEADPDARLVDFLSYVLDDVQNFWEDTFEGSGREYQRAKLVLFEAATPSACGGATENIGPHYCPPDQQVYIDLDFFRDLRDNYGAPGDFAQAYVLAHEIGHHVQHLLGFDRKVNEASASDRNEMSIRLELQADCFSGVWAYTVFEAGDLEEGDLEEGLGAAEAVGDDRLQEAATGEINRETWTHGSSEQRMRWFRAGFEDGDPNDCDTFSAGTL